MWGWRAVMALPILGALVVPLLWRALPTGGSGARLDVVGAIVVALTASGMVLLVQSPSAGLLVAAIGASLLVLGVPAVRASVRRRPDGFLPVEVIRNPTVVRSAVAASAVPASWFAMLIALPAVLLAEGWEAWQVGLAMVPSAAVCPARAQVAGPMLTRLGPSRCLAIAGLVASTALLVATVGALWASAPVLVAGIILVTFAFGLGQPALSAAVNDAVHDDVRGVAMGVSTLLFLIGGSVGSAVVAGISGPLGMPAALLVLAVLPLLGLVVLARRCASHRSTPEAQSVPKRYGACQWAYLGCEFPPSKEPCAISLSPSRRLSGPRRGSGCTELRSLRSPPPRTTRPSPPSAASSRPARRSASSPSSTPPPASTSAPCAPSSRRRAAPRSWRSPDRTASSSRSVSSARSGWSPSSPPPTPRSPTWSGVGVTDPLSTIALDITQMGFHAFVRTPGGRSDWYVDPAYNRAGTTAHLSYRSADLPATAVRRQEGEVDAIRETVAAAAADRSTAPGTQVKRHYYRLALTSATRRTPPTSAPPNVLAEKVTLMNRVNQIYNDDLAIRAACWSNGTDKLNLDTDAKATGADGPCGSAPCFAPYDDNGTPDDQSDDSPGDIGYCDVCDAGQATAPCSVS